MGDYIISWMGVNYGSFSKNANIPDSNLKQNQHQLNSILIIPMNSSTLTYEQIIKYVILTKLRNINLMEN